MGNPSTERTKMQDRRKKLRRLLPDVTEQVIDGLSSIDDPEDRFKAALAIGERIGCTPARIEQLRQRLFAALTQKYGSRDAAIAHLWDQAPEQPDDTRYRPAYVDPVLRGAGRATGQTAAAVRRGRTVTGWQHRDREVG